MKCNHCGAEISNDVKECPYCDAVVVREQLSKEPVHQVIIQSEAVPDVVEQAIVPQNPLIGKKYVFTSTRGTNIAGFFNSRITSDVQVAEDRLFIDIKPKRFNKSPAVLFEDITGVDITKNINLCYWGWIVLSFLAGFSAPYCFIFVVLFIFFGLQRKITISQRSGIKVVMYTTSKEEAEAFKEDMKMVARIQ